MYLNLCYRAETKGPAINPAECRIINLSLLNKHTNNVAKHVATCQPCIAKAISSQECTFISDEKHHGFASVISSKCGGCGKVIPFSTSTKLTDSGGGQQWTNNFAAVWGQMVVGGGFNHLQESMSVLGIPTMCKNSFMATECAIGKWWWDVLEKSMKAAGEEEWRIAIEQNSYHHEVPAITVILDGGWSKRTHRHSYNALSVVGVIFGKQTGKLLYIGVRNKFCAACVYQNKQTGANKKTNHTCFKNWSGPSASMETDIILEGFQAAEKQHGVRYMRFIGDGDSSVHPTLVANVHEWGYDIQKEECANHAVKCFRTSMEQLVKDKPQYKGRGKLTEQMRKRLTLRMRSSITNRSKETDSRKAAKLLRIDILTCAPHCFGIHNKCNSDYCKVAKNKNTPNETNSTTELTSLPISITYSHSGPSTSNECLEAISIPHCTNQDGRFSPSTSSSLLGFNSTGNHQHISEVLENDTLDEILSEQQDAWQDATTDEPVDLPEPSDPVDNAMLCDIQKYASRLAGKASQLIGKQLKYKGT